MAFNPFDPALFAVKATCMPCCVEPAVCECALLIPPFASPYADYATAEGVVSNPLQVAGCIAWMDKDFFLVTRSSFSASFDGTTLAASSSCTAASPFALGMAAYSSISGLSGGVVSMSYSITTDGGPLAGLRLLDCATGDILDSDSSSSSSGTIHVTIPSDGIFYILYGASASSATSFSMSADVTCDMAFTVNPVIALWDDSGTTRPLDACPKMLLPPLTEHTGTWYASCADAHTDLTNPLKVSNCVGFWPSVAAEVTSITATNGGTFITLATDASGAGFNGDTLAWCSVNAVAGDTLSMAWASAANGRMTIYDDTGTLVEVVGSSVSSPVTSSPLPYTGRYTIHCEAYNAIFDPPLPSSSVTVTSSGTMSVNTIQAVYDLGLTCPGRLNCGDSCP